MIEFTMPDLIVNLYWKIRRYYWGKKPEIRKVKTAIKFYISIAKHELHTFFINTTAKKRNQLKCFLGTIRTALLWNLQISIVVKKGRRRVVWFLREFGGRLFWNMRRKLDAACAKSIKMYWKVKNSVAFYPLVKAYWFLYYQLQKRALPPNNKKTNKN